MNNTLSDNNLSNNPSTDTVASAVPGNAKPHYELLDGLRGVAALLVLWFHVFEAYATDAVDQRFNHGYLAVDFFFILSGFVMGYAYDDRWGRSLGRREFFLRRLIRLHPMVLFGAVTGLVAYCLQGCVRWDGCQVTAGAIAVAFLLNLLLLPVIPGAAADVRGNNEMFPLNGPNWSLFFEYIGNVLYALVLHRLPTRSLRWVVGVSGVALALFAVGNGSGSGHLGVGWSMVEYNLPGGLLRLMFSYSAGLLLAREFRPRKIRGAFWICSAVLVLAAVVPHVGGRDQLWMNGLYDSVCVLFLFPAVVCAGASGRVSDRTTAGICRFLGDVSYPLYVVHYPLMYLFYAWVWESRVPWSEAWPVAVGVLVASVLLAWAALRLYDQPVRRALSRRLLGRGFSVKR